MRMTRVRKGVRVRMDAGTVERLRRQLATRDVDRAGSGLAWLKSVLETGRECSRHAAQLFSSSAVVVA